MVAWLVFSPRSEVLTARSGLNVLELPRLAVHVPQPPSEPPPVEMVPAKPIAVHKSVPTRTKPNPGSRKDSSKMTMAELDALLGGAPGRPPLGSY